MSTGNKAYEPAASPIYSYAHMRREVQISIQKYISGTSKKQLTSKNN